MTYLQVGEEGLGQSIDTAEILGDHLGADHGIGALDLVMVVEVHDITKRGVKRMSSYKGPSQS